MVSYERHALVMGLIPFSPTKRSSFFFRVWDVPPLMRLPDALDCVPWEKKDTQV